MNCRRVILTILIFFAGKDLFSQVAKSKLYLAIDDYGDNARAYLNKVGNKNVQVIYGHEIYDYDPSINKEAKVNRIMLENRIKQVFPEKTLRGIGVLDWEGRSFDLLSSVPESNSVYQDVLSEFLYAFNIAKALRPNILWTFYGMPFKRINFKTESEWLLANNKIAPLLKKLDVLCPDLYGYTPSDLGNLQDVRLGIELGLKYGKKVYPFIWHRYNGGTHKKYILKMIPKNTFIKYAVKVAKTRYGNKQVDGVIWWSKDTYFYEHKEAAVVKESPNFNTFKRYYDQIIIDYSKAVMQAIK